MARPGFRQHVKFKRLVHVLQEPLPHVWGYMECLWEVAYQNGEEVIGDELDVEVAAEFPGEQGKLCKALLECRLIDRLEDGRFAIHDLFENAPEYVRKRFERDQSRKIKYAPRDRARGVSPPNSGVRRLTPPKSELGGVRPHSQHPTPIEDAGASCSEPASPSSEPTASPPNESKPILEFPTVGKGAKTWQLSEDKMREYAEVFPSIEVLAECRKALQWCRDNPKKRKTARGMPAFLTRWLTREQNSGRGATNTNNATSAQQEEDERKASAETLARIKRDKEQRPEHDPTWLKRCMGRDRINGS